MREGREGNCIASEKRERVARSIDSGEGAASGECEISIPSPAVKGAEGGRESELSGSCKTNVSSARSVGRYSQTRTLRIRKPREVAQGQQALFYFSNIYFGIL